MTNIEDFEWLPGSFGPYLNVKNWPKECDGALICINDGHGIQPVRVAMPQQIRKEDVETLSKYGDVSICPVMLANHHLVLSTGKTYDKLGWQ